MIFAFRQSVLALIALATLNSILVAQVRPTEQANARDWVAKHLAGGVGELPFSFQYDGKPSSEVLKRFEAHTTEIAIDEVRSRRELTFTDPETGLEVRCDAVIYHDYPTVEWTLYFKNSSAKDTPILSEIRALDIVVEREGGDEFVLHHHKGSRATPDDFRPRAASIPGRTGIQWHDAVF
jgi:alpha-galactosidase